MQSSFSLTQCLAFTFFVSPTISHRHSGMWWRFQGSISGSQSNHLLAAHHQTAHCGSQGTKKNSSSCLPVQANSRLGIWHPGKRRRKKMKGNFHLWHTKPVSYYCRWLFTLQMYSEYHEILLHYDQVKTVLSDTVMVIIQRDQMELGAELVCVPTDTVLIRKS